MKKPMKILTTLLCLQTLLLACSTPINKPSIKNTHNDQYAHLKKYIEKYVPQSLRKHDIAAMHVLVLDNQEIIYNQGFGFADKDKAIKADHKTAYRIGSITKLFTATAIMQLHEQGKLDIDQALTHYLPEFSIQSDNDINGITLRRMMTHHSGLPSDFLKGLNSDNKKNLFTDLAKTYTTSAPDTVHSYSNLAYGLLGDVIERVSGLPYRDYMQQFLFTPSTMQHATVGIDHPFLATAYKQGKAQTHDNIRDTAAGDISMSAEDLAQFAKRLLNNKATGTTAGLIKHDTLNTMWQAQNSQVTLDNGFTMGLGWMLSALEPELHQLPHLAWHSGSIGGFHSSLMMDIENKLTVIVLSNSEASSKTVDTLSGELLLKTIESKTGYQHSAYQPKSQKIKQFSPEQLTRLPGEYLSPYVGAFTIERKNQQLKFTSEAMNLHLTPMDDGSIGAHYKLLGLFPIYDKALNSLRIETVQHKQETLLQAQNGPVVAQKITPSELTQTWQGYLGEFIDISDYTNLDKPDWVIERITLANYKGYLRAETFLRDSNEAEIAYLKPVSPTRAVLIGYGRSMGDSVQVTRNNNGEIIIHYSGLSFRQVK